MGTSKAGVRRGDEKLPHRALEPIAFPTVRAINWVHVLGGLFLPSKASLVLLALAVTWVVLVGGCSVAVFSGSNLTGAVSGLVVVPVGAVIAFLAAILAGSATSRSLLFGLTALMTAFGAMVIPLGDVSLEQMEVDPGAIVISIVLYGIPVVLTGGLSVFYGARGIKEIADRITQAREDHLCEVLIERGEASFLELSKASGIAESQIDDVIEAQIAAGRLAAVLDTGSQRGFTVDRYLAKEQDLVSAVQARGRASIYDVAKSLGLSEVRFREILYAAMAHGRFTGYVDFKRGVVFSVDGQRLREGKLCPACGGRMDLAGHGAVVCGYCGTEVLLT